MTAQGPNLTVPLWRPCTLPFSNVLISTRSAHALADFGRNTGLVVDTIREDVNFNGGSFLVFQKAAK
jgi:hypothetical protein